MAWIAELRARVERGDLTALGPIDFGDGLPTLTAEHAVQLMLTDLDELEAITPSEANDPVNVARRASLLADFRTLQLLFG
jgi:hypothetical protein